MSIWNRFMDMNSGGGPKLDSDYIWIEAPESEAAELFEAILGRDPHNVTCPCCGEDYSYYEREPEIKERDIVISADDIARYRGGLKLEADHG